MSHTLLWQEIQNYEHFWTFISSEEYYSVCDVDVVVRRDWRFLSLMGLSWNGWTLLVLFGMLLTGNVPEVVVVYIPEDPSHDLVLERWNLLGFDHMENIPSLNNNILAGLNWKIIAENTERLPIQTPIFGLVKDEEKSVSRKEAIWNEEWHKIIL